MAPILVIGRRCMCCNIEFPLQVRGQMRALPLRDWTLLRSSRGRGKCRAKRAARYVGVELASTLFFRKEARACAGYAGGCRGRACLDPLLPESLFEMA